MGEVTRVKGDIMAYYEERHHAVLNVLSCQSCLLSVTGVLGDEL